MSEKENKVIEEYNKSKLLIPKRNIDHTIRVWDNHSFKQRGDCEAVWVKFAEDRYEVRLPKFKGDRHLAVMLSHELIHYVNHIMGIKGKQDEDIATEMCKAYLKCYDKYQEEKK